MNMGIIFDWDGVIIDSSCYHKESWERLALEKGRKLPPGHFKKGFGMKNELIIPEILGWTNEPREINQLSLRKEQLYREIMEKKGIMPLPGVREFLSLLHRKNVTCAIGSSTHKENISLALRLLKFERYFSAVISAEDVDHGKPNPQVFLKAAERIGIHPAKCIVFEDALVGIRAARAGNMKVVAVATTNPVSRLSEADRIVKRMDMLTIEDLVAITGVEMDNK
jgi:beta-phosphoglucomutase family hydrolase